LPTTLVECFKSTLDEIREADILLHVVDVSHPACEEQIEIVNRTLAEIGAADKPTVLVFNKIDLYHNEEAIVEENSEELPVQNGLERLKATLLEPAEHSGRVCVGRAEGTPR
jgi:GTP-binding protein HflX